MATRGGDSIGNGGGGGCGGGGEVSIGNTAAEWNRIQIRWYFWLIFPL